MQKNKWDFFLFLVLEVSAMLITGAVALTSMWLRLFLFFKVLFLSTIYWFNVWKKIIVACRSSYWSSSSIFFWSMVKLCWYQSYWCCLIFYCGLFSLLWCCSLNLCTSFSGMLIECSLLCFWLCWKFCSLLVILGISSFFLKCMFWLCISTYKVLHLEIAFLLDWIRWQWHYWGNL